MKNITLNEAKAWTAEEINQIVMGLDMKNLTKAQIAWLHDLKAQATKGWAARELASLKQEVASNA